jgi:AraC-like DNA-binding protein
MNEIAMETGTDRHLFLPKADRSFWRCGEDFDGTLRYLAWGGRNFDSQPVPASRHDGWVCVVIQEGSPELRAASVSHRLTAGTFALIGPDCSFGWSPSGSGICRILLWLWREFADPALAGEPRDACRIRMLQGSVRKALLTLHNLCRVEVLGRSPSVGYIEGCRLMFEATITRDVLGPSPASISPAEFVHLAETWMAAHLDSREPVARLCDYLNLSQSTLYRGFRDELGIGPLVRFQQLRMEKAKHLISEDGMTVKEAAFRLGYGHFNDLSRAYSKHFGVSPTQDR